MRSAKGVKMINDKKTKCVNGDQRQFSFAYILDILKGLKDVNKNQEKIRTGSWFIH